MTAYKRDKKWWYFEKEVMITSTGVTSKIRNYYDRNDDFEKAESWT